MGAQHCPDGRSALVNHGASAVSFDLTIDFFSDFADIFEVRGMRRPARGTLHRQVMGPNEVLLRYTGLDGKVRETALTFEPVPAVLTISQAKYVVTLEPRRPWQQSEMLMVFDAEYPFEPLPDPPKRSDTGSLSHAYSFLACLLTMLQKQALKSRIC